MNKIFFLVIFLWTCSGYSQEHDNHLTIKGKVITTNSKGIEESVPGAKLKWAKGEHMALTNKDGFFEIHADSLPDTLFIKFVGYQLIAFEIKDTSTQFVFSLTEGTLLKGVNVYAENLNKHIDLMSPFGIETIGQNELRKAACCNLSESFETNASVDVNITDAISGAKKIQMLGLDGIYTQLQWENIPLVRGLSTSYGLNFTPGTWIHSIQITKGTGSVVNGYESMAGVINLELIKSSGGPKFYLNTYGNRFGRAELNMHGAQSLNDKWSTMSFMHISNSFIEYDVNEDGFRDSPFGFLGAFMNRWSYEGSKFEAKFGVKATYSDKLGGQMGYNTSDESIPLWGAEFNTEHLELFTKNGFFFDKRPQGSLGLIGQGKYHHMINVLGPSKYEGTQKKFYFNGIYSDIIKNTNHSYKTGTSFIYDDYIQSYNDSTFLKTEIVPGAFFEYTYNRLDKIIIVSGLRGDYHNMYGALVAPRLHAKWNPNPKSALRLSVGRGLRVPNPFADYVGMMASSRTWIVSPDIEPEDAISSGITYSQKFLTNDEVSSISFDYFYTHFFNQLIIDMDVSPNELYIYNTDAESFSHSVQVELSIKPTKTLEFRSAFKYYDVKSVYNGVLSQKAFVPKYRVLLNAGYASRNKKWLFDITGNWIGKKRLPPTASNPIEYQRSTESKSYWLLNSQITYNLKRFSIYIGGENLLNVIQKDAIIAADDPFGSYFDATQIWAPIRGFNVYAGLHFEIKQKEKK